MNIKSILFFLCYFVCYSNSQENTENQVAPSLQECYRNQELVSRNNRLPTSVSVLIELIRKIENEPSFSMDMRQLSKSILHRFKQDGILRANVPKYTDGVLPYSPVGIQFRKHQILMKKLIPGDAIQFNNESLTASERCSLHYMISNTQQEETFGNNILLPCSKTGYYRRHARDVSQKTDFSDDTSQVHLTKNKRDVDDEVDILNTNSNRDENKQCISEGGVLYTHWGPVSIGAVISGIAAGLSPQSPSVNQLKNERDGGSNLRVDNIWASTFSGDLAEVSLSQGEKLAMGTRNDIRVGGNGVWNSTSSHRWYFLNSDTKIELTDAEIRGDLDGLILGTNVQKWTNEVPDLKLSQLLDMYYSSRGVFDKKYRACARNILFSEVASTENLKDQTLAFTEVSEPLVILHFTLNRTTLQSWSNKAVSALIAYLPTLVDVKCRDSERNLKALDTNVNVGVDLVIAIDHTWPYKAIELMLSYIVEQIEVNMYASNVTIISAVSGQTIVNATNTILDFYTQFNETVYKNLGSASYNMERTMQKIKLLTMEKLDYEKDVNSIEGKSQIALLIIHSSEPFQYEPIKTQLDIMSEKTPDLRFLYVVQNNKDRFDNISKDAWTDTFLISTIEDKAELDKVIDRLQKYPRRITNPSCGSLWNSEREGNHQHIQYMNTDSVSYYKLSPNYFYKSGNYIIKIQNHNPSSKLTICYSRTVDSTSQDETCKTIATSTENIELNDPCSNSKFIHDCEPLYITIKAESNGVGYNCNGKSCRFPDSLRLSISTENLVCQSNGNLVNLSLVVMIFACIIRLL